MINCSLCNKEFEPKPGTVGKFCSLSCSCSYNGTIKALSTCKKYYMNAPQCKKCGSVIDYFQRKSAKEYCSSSCSAKHTQLNKSRGNYKTKQSMNNCPPKPKYRNCKNCSIEFRTIKNNKYCSDDCRKIKLSEKMKHNALMYNYQSHRNPYRQSYLESSFEQWLMQNNYKKGIKGYLTEVCFKNKEHNKIGRLDFLFPKLKVIIELDGTQHNYTIDKDKIRDKYLESRGYIVIRITHKEYKNKTKIDYIKRILDIN